MALRAERIEVKQVGMNGQISLGKEYAGKQVQVFKSKEGIITIKTGAFIPDNERWLYKGDNLERLNKAIAEAKSRSRSDNYEEIKKRILEND